MLSFLWHLDTPHLILPVAKEWIMLKWTVVIISIAIIWRWMSKTPLTKKKLSEEYDYVIVGAGSAGAIVAARLSEDPDVKVAVLEAGPDNDDFPEAAIPLSFPMLRKTPIDWAFMTEPQKHACYSLENKQVAYPRGRGLGGSSLINAMGATRGSRHDYDRWAEMGNVGWSYEDVLPYFKKMETFIDEKNSGSEYRGKNGPVQIRVPDVYEDITTAFLEGAESQGFIVGDVNVEEASKRVMANQENIGTDGVRQSTAVTYLKPAMSRDNLHVLTNAHVTKVLFEGKRAVGVQYMHNGLLKTVRCRKEVILSAGTIGSPQILLLSGVGPKEHLEDMKIPVIADLPVGQNLHDHVLLYAVIATLEKPVALVPERLGLLDKLQYDLFGTGPFSTVGGLALAVSRSKHQPQNHHQPYLQFILMANMLNSEGARKNINMKPEIHQALFGGLDGKDGLNLFLSLQQPASVGYVRLNSANPFDHPLINPNYLAEESDVHMLLEGVRMSRKLMSSDALVNQLGAKIIERVHPNCAHETYDSDEYWKCFIHQNMLSLNHPHSACRMGPKSDSNSVVDPKLRVHGLQGLRVVDASVVPHVASGNLNVISMMIGERAADIIKGKN